MQLEFHQLDQRRQHLRVREPQRHRHLLASLAEAGQQTPIVVVLAEDNSAEQTNQRYLVIDGHKPPQTLAAIEQRYGYSIEESARRLDRGTTWVSRRLALVELLPEAIQQPVREGAIAAQLAMKYLAPAII